MTRNDNTPQFLSREYEQERDTKLATQIVRRGFPSHRGFAQFEDRMFVGFAPSPEPEIVYYATKETCDFLGIEYEESDAVNGKLYLRAV